MNTKQNRRPESIVREIRRNTRRKYSTEEKIRIVLEGLKGEVSIAELCCREGIVSNLYYRWSKDFLEAGKKRLAGRYGPWERSSDHYILIPINTRIVEWSVYNSLFC